MAMNIGKPACDAIMIIRKFFVIDAHQMKNSGVEVINGNRIVCNLVAYFIRGAIFRTSLDPRTCKPASESMLVMISAQRLRAPITLRKRRAAKLG